MTRRSAAARVFAAALLALAAPAAAQAWPAAIVE